MYDTDAGLLYRLGLMTQIPNEWLIATNAARKCVWRDEKLNVTICPPKTLITADNKMYLQTLDALEQLDHAPIDAEEPYRLLAEHIQRLHVKYHMLLSLADQYDPQRTILQLEHQFAYEQNGFSRFARYRASENRVSEKCIENYYVNSEGKSAAKRRNPKDFSL